MAWHDKRRIKTWKITFYLDEQVYDVEICTAYRKPIQFAGYIRDLATHFVIEELEGNHEESII